MFWKKNDPLTEIVISTKKRLQCTLWKNNCHEEIDKIFTTSEAVAKYLKGIKYNYITELRIKDVKYKQIVHPEVQI